MTTAKPLNIPHLRIDIHGRILKCYFLTFINIYTGERQVWLSNKELCSDFFNYKNPTDVAKRHTTDDERKSWEELCQTHLAGIVFNVPHRWHKSNIFVSEEGIRKITFHAYKAALPFFRAPLLDLINILRKDNSIGRRQQPLALEFATNQNLIAKVKFELAKLEHNLKQHGITSENVSS